MDPKKQHVVLIRMEQISLLLVKMEIIIKLTFQGKKVIVKLFLKKVSNELFIFELNDVIPFILINIFFKRHN